MRLEDVPEAPRRSKYDTFFEQVRQAANQQEPNDRWLEFPNRKPLRTLYEYGRRIRKGTMANCGPGFEATVYKKRLLVRYNET